MRLLTFFLLGAATVGSATAARPHEGLRSADPGAGDTLAVAPTQLRLTFTGPVRAGLASVTLTGPDGSVALGEPEAHSDSSSVLIVRIEAPVALGEHDVSWRIIGSDGHPVEGQYTFTVARGARGPASTTADSAGVAAAADSGERFTVLSPAFVVVRWARFATLVVLLGAAMFLLVVAPLVRHRHGAVDGMDEPRAARTGSWAAAVLLVVAGARLAAQGAAVAGTGAPDPGLLGELVTGTTWGLGWGLEVVGAVAALIAFRRGPGRVGMTGLAGAAAVALAFTPALSGHAVGAERLGILPVLADGLHVLAAGGWIGGLAILLLVALPAARRAAGGDEEDDGAGHAGAGGDRRLRPVVEGFSTTFLVSAGLLGATGLFAAWLHLPTLEALWTTDYGRTLLLKLALLSLVLGTGAYNFLRVRPALDESDPDTGAHRLRGSAGIELAVATAVLLVTAVLVATPPPDEAAPVAEATEGAPAPTTGDSEGTP